MPTRAPLGIAPLERKTPKQGEVERVHRLIKGWILQGRAKPGDFIAEVELAQHCRTSRTPVREACNRLSQEGWITHIRHKGYLVPLITVREVADVYEYRKLLEVFTAGRAAEVATPGQCGALQAALEAEHRPQASPEALIVANHAVHLGLADIAGNRRVLDQLRRVLEYVDRLDVLSLEKDADVVFHDGIVRAIGSRDAGAAREAMAAHIDAARDRMVRLFGA